MILFGLTKGSLRDDICLSTVLFLSLKHIKETKHLRKDIKNHRVVGGLFQKTDFAVRLGEMSGGFRKQQTKKKQLLLSSLRCMYCIMMYYVFFQQGMCLQGLSFQESSALSKRQCQCFFAFPQDACFFSLLKT